MKQKKLKIIFNIDNPINIVTDVLKNAHEILWELFFCLDYFKSNLVHIKKLIFTYFPYSRSDKGTVDRTCNLNTILSFLSIYPINEIVTFDLHFQTEKIDSRIKIKSIKHIDIFGSLIDEDNINNYLIISPDKGGFNRAIKYKDKFGIPVICMEKSRTDHTEKVNYIINKENQKTIEYAKQIYIIDDEICSGNTLQQLIKVVRKNNPPAIIKCFITHCFNQKIDDSSFLKDIDMLAITNTLENPCQSQKIKTVDIIPFIEKELNEN